MTDQSKIPVPGSKEAEKEARRISSLERAAGKGFDLNRYIAAPIPAADIPEKPKREVATPAPAPEPVAAPTPVAAPAPVEAAEPQLVADPAPEPEPVVEPVVFIGKKHPIDRAQLRDQALIVPEGNVTALLEEFRIVRRKVLVNAAELRRQGIGASAQRVLVSSPHSGEGKTYCSINLAMAISAEKESEVLLVDSDFAKPSILSMLGLPGGPGLMDALVDPEADVADFVIGTDIPGLWVLPSGNTTNSDTEYLNSSRTEKVLDRLTQGTPNRIVLFDTPPVLAASTAQTMAKYVSQALVVVRADRTGQGSLEDAVSLLSACPNIELLLNAVHFSPSGRKFGSYYSYGG
jgi:Mrp family chromosome partitioning ATPase